MRKNTDKSYFRYWGKASRDDDSYHLLVYHCLDVAAVGWQMMRPNGQLCRRLASMVSVDPEWLQHWFTFTLMLHDIGKFARAFQNLAPDLSAELVPYRGQCVYQIRHDSLGYLIWKNRLRGPMGVWAKAIDPFIEIVCGHHGQPPKPESRGFASHVMEEDFAAVDSYLGDIIGWWQPDFLPLEYLDKQALRHISWQLSGVAILADWLGSNPEIFDYSQEIMSLNIYWEDFASKRAPKALDLASCEQSDVAQFTGIRQQFPFIDEPTPLQQFAAQQTLAQGPQLFILEDITGAGKTEAALVLAHRLMAQGEARGLYVALPTMATANAMYDRLSNSYRSLFGHDALPSLILAHGAARQSDGFIETIAFSGQRSDRNYQQGDETASAYCNAWLADNRKKALLADVGVGTIDQALLGVLPARHQSLRLLGLTDKVLLVDEVHAYDPYMRALLVALLEMHARLGGCAILLSATLAQSYRGELASAFAKGLGADSPTLQQTGFPLANHLSATSFQEQPLESRPELYRRVEVIRLGSEDEVVEVIRQAIERDQSVCWIRNTVGDARAAYDHLVSEPWCARDKLTLFHSRFAMVDRQRVEKDVLSRFGKDSGDSQRAGQVLVATQVVEQSLDLDFDVMISDLAPVDLVIQRAGRLHRHKRDESGNRIDAGDDQRPSPRLYLLAPDHQSVDDDQWLKRILPGTQAVYQNVGQIWLTVSELMKEEGYRLPEDARRLIEGVYGEAAQARIPKVLQELTWQAQGIGRSKYGMGEFNRLKLSKGYTRLSGDWDEEVRIPTRLGDDSVTVVLARVEDDILTPYADVPRHAWALSQISLPKKDWEHVKGKIDSRIQREIEKLKAEQPGLRWFEVLPLTAEIAQHYDPNGGWNRNRRKRSELD